MPYSDKQKAIEYQKRYRKANRLLINRKRAEYVKLNYEKIKRDKKESYLLRKDEINKVRREKYRSNPYNQREDSKKYYYSKLEDNRVKCKRYHEINREKMKILCRNYYKNNRDKIIKQNADYRHRRIKTDSEYKIRCLLRTRIGNAIRNQYGKKAYKTEELLGTTIKEVRKYLESKFVENMSWNNYGEWHIDHIIPINSFNLISPEEQKKACHYTNLQPLWAFDNLSKGDRIK